MPYAPPYGPTINDPCDDATRRRFLAGMVAAGLLAGCGDSSDEAAGPREATRRVTNQFGSFDVPLEPKRVVGWEGRRDLETALALGLKPIAIGSNAVFGNGRIAPFLPFDLEGVEVIEKNEPDLELIARLRPDLILTEDANIEALREPLRGIGAPLVPVAGVGPWRPDLEAIAQALGRSEQISSRLAGYDELRSEIRARHADRIARATLAAVQYSEGTFEGSSTKSYRLQANTIADLGGRHLPFLERGATLLDNKTFSVEQTGRLRPADAIIVIVNTDDERRELEDSKLWQQLPAV